jgi:hypothetical protein
LAKYSNVRVLAPEQWRALRSKSLEIAERKAARERKGGDEEEAGPAARQDHGLLSPEWRTHR